MIHLFQTLSARIVARVCRGALVAFAALVLLTSSPLLADPPTPATVVGDVVTHPVTGVDATVVQVLGNSVLTDNDDVILVYYTVGDSFEDPNDPNMPPATVTIASVSVNGTTGFVDQYTLDNGDVIDVARPVDTSVPPGAEGAPGDPGGPITVSIPTGNSGVIAVAQRGSRGADGNDGYGIEICDPTGIFGGCFIIGYGGTGGGSGGTGPAVSLDVTPRDIESISVRLAGISGKSVGGDGGTGGDAYGNFDGRPGGNAGAGGTVSIISSADITTQGLLAHGIYGQSRSGSGGSGGSGYILGGGGTGGVAAQGGTVTLTNNGNITTFGAGAKGMFGQSTGGSAGSGGDSWGIVGSAGSSRAGGNGGTVTLTNNGTIITSGLAAHGMLSQSVGGTGGDGGDAGGVVSFGGGGSVGGNGGTANGNLGTTGGIRTLGSRAHGMFVQSIGGGGGSGGTGGGVVAFGGTGSGGGSAGTVNVTNATGGLILTEGDGSSAILAQSIGGGGGDGGTGGGVVALGGSGSAAGNGGLVNVDNGAQLRTVGEDAYGLFAQSVGGGGGTARGTGGYFSLGGAGGSGGAGNSVDVVNNARIQTDGARSDAIVAQSVGGGGGAGGGTGGVISLGGAGSSGGAGGTVLLENNAQVTTLGEQARGLFAQSVGGGGGFGGDSGGSVTIGGRGGSTSAGGSVTLTNSGAVTTEGERAHAVQAQSIGGGGGDGGTAGGVFFTLGGSGGGGGTGGTATVNNSNDLTTMGTEARGVFAQSVGGGGGNGGGSYSGSAFVGVAIGGSATGGGNGNTVTVTSSDYTRIIDGNPVLIAPFIQTHGDRANGIYAQSVGGGGGNGGLAVQVTGGAFGAISAAVGGTGGGGGIGGTARLFGNATVATAGVDADGVVVQSVGGGGGSGGGAVSVGVAVGPAAGSVSVGVGGAGGSGGLGGSVMVDAGGNITTTGDLSEGFLAQSVGGGGGKGGWVVNASVAASAGGSVAVGIGVGGRGGDGGVGGVVDATYAGDVRTSGDNADAWTAQSVGGGGGQGGFNVTGVIAGSAGGSGGVAVGVGGAGGGGGNASAVTGDLTGNLTTTGTLSDGMVVQSVGGGGGSGGVNISGNISIAPAVGIGVSVGVGGAGGLGGDGSTATLRYLGNAVTSGDSSVAVLAQSGGGGGGNGALNVSGGIAGSSGGSASISVGVGGAGGGGGTGGAVSSTVDGSVMTTGAMSDAVVTQSMGGGGGNGGINVSADVAISAAGSGTVSVGVGGAGGGGGDGGTVNATVLADVTTTGFESDAVLSQSVGGGGGNGALNVAGGVSGSSGGSGSAMVGVGGSGGGPGNAGSVTSAVRGIISTWGDESDGVITQSLGGGGGNGGINVSGGLALSTAGSGTVGVGVGGAGGGGGSGGVASASVSGAVTTRGQASTGVLTQSVGGGGGNGGLNVSGGLAGSTGGSAAIMVGVGGSGGLGGAAVAATSTITADITTFGLGSAAIVTQSQGGGGGNGGLNVSGGVALSSAGSGTVAVGFGGAGGGGGSSAAADASVTGNVTTHGIRSTGVLVQSTGGGGGNGGLNVSGGLSFASAGSGGFSLGVGGFGGSGGAAGIADLDLIGNVTTHGFGSEAVVVQSLGGGGGNGALNVSGNVALSAAAAVPISIGVGGFGGGGGNGADASLSLTGSVFTVGADTDAVTIQSIGGGGGRGGINVSGALGISTGGAAFSTALGLGGFGGSGGDAGNVSATINGDVRATGIESDLLTEVEHFLPPDTCVSFPTLCSVLERTRLGGSNAIVAQSVGGSGGSGGLNVSAGISAGSSSGLLNLGVGGFGGGGGNAGIVDLTVNSTAVTAAGDNRNAVTVQSLGGGGGNGALNVSGGITGNGQLTVGVGGFGGDGGTSAAVTARVTGAMEVDGNGSRGLLAQSIGGGGGNGGINISGGINALPGAGAPSLFFGLGGAGGAGNSSNRVDVTQRGSVVVKGRDAIGVLAQSVGGGGGSGGLNVTGSPLSLGEGFVAAVGIGGRGGAGADAGDVTLISDGVIQADGRVLDLISVPVPTDPEVTDFTARANGILVQSIGGGGGQGGINISGVIAPLGHVLAAGVGGTGGGGGHAGAVTVQRGLNEAAQLQTFGHQSNGLTVQSVGGGGGDAGMNFVVAANGAGDPGSFESLIVIGGGGGDPGHGAAVTVDHIGSISTDGEQSNGLLAQSVGGGGGNAALSIGAGLNRNASGINVAVGGGPGEGGNGSTVDVNHSGTITTRGADSVGLFAQSVGGGGGNAAMTAAFALLASNKLDVGVGRYGGTGGTGGAVSVESSGFLSTSGARSVGLLAQSVGNGGGRSGSFVIAAKGSRGEGDTKEAASAAVSVGLEGGEGGDAGTVDVVSSGTITTGGADAHAIQAQSVGGGGGIGGSATNLIMRETAAARVGVGGTGGTGGIGGLVDVQNSGALITSGAKAHGVYAQSVGGGGGTGGLAGLVSLQLGGEAARGNNSIGVSVGGTGGTGADGGMVMVANEGLITTHGGESFGIDAQSVGGGGGDGGMVINGSLSGSSRQSALDVNVGGSGGTGGDGMSVTVNNRNQIITHGGQALGIRAQSIGGGGGNAGLVANLSINRSTSDTSSASVAVNIGGTGGTGGDGGLVSVTNESGGSILTSGEKSHGLFAQSIGGGGGNGGSVLSTEFSGGSSGTTNASYGFGFNMGGTGGVGGVGGTVTATNDDLIDTGGAGAHGIYAQSVGGGGGTGGLAIATNVNLTSLTGSALTIAVGGQGGDGGDAGTVTVNNRGRIITRGANAHGIVAQSIGGGGGDANIGLGVSNPLIASLLTNVVSAIVGGSLSSSSDGGMGGTVVVNHSGDITVLGEGSQVIKAESINGGGGGLVLDFNGVTSLPGGEGLPGVPGGTDPGLSVDPLLRLRAGGDQQMNMTAGAVTINSTGTFGAAGAKSTVLGIQSIGGGGGTLRLDLDFAEQQRGGLLGIAAQLGGSGGVDNHGGAISSSHNGNILTNGVHSSGGSLQSIGGGGGRGFVTAERQANTLGAVSAVLGAEGGARSDGANVVHNHAGDIMTTGSNALGFLVQSIGAGGGELHLSGMDSAGITFGGQSDAIGDAGDIDFDFHGEVTTLGERAHGIFLQSIGGGGGVAFADSLTDLQVQASAANSGSGGDIDFSLNSEITTTGRGAVALFAQSLGGGGGYADGIGAISAGGQGAGGNLSLVLNGAVRSATATAVYLQSDGAGGSGDISLNIGTTGEVSGGADSVALILAGGADNRIANRGSLTSFAGGAGWAVQSGAGSELIENFGTIAGSIDLGSGANSLVNHRGALLASGSQLNLGSSSAVFSNQGTLSPGGVGLVRQTQLNGSLVQTGDARALMEIDFASGAVDALFATGSAALTGPVEVGRLNVARIRPGAGGGTLFSAAGGLTDNGVSLSTAVSAVIGYRLQTSAVAATLAYDVDFVPAGLGENLNAVARYITQGQIAGGGNDAYGAVIEKLVSDPDLAAYRDSLSQLSPEFYAEQQVQAIDGSIEFGRLLMSCHKVGGEHRFTSEGSCFWMQVQDENRDLEAHGDYKAIDSSTTHFSVGGQKTLENDWTFGAGFARERTDSDGYDQSWSASTLTYQLGLSAKRRFGATKVTTVLNYGWNDTDSFRSGSFLDTYSTQVNRDSNVLSLGFRAQHDFDVSAWIIRPILDLGISHFRADDAQEVGLGAASLVFDDYDETFTWVRPAVELIREIEVGAENRLRLNLEFGVQQYLNDAESEVEARFAGAPTSIDPLTIQSDLGDPVYGGSFGIDFLTGSNAVLQLYYQRSWSDHRDSDAIRLKFEMPF